MEIINRLVISILATYRLAHLLPEDEGPFFIFTHIRSFIATGQMMENKESGLWNNLDKWAECPYCQGIYMAALAYYLSRKNNKFAMAFLLIFAIAGGQSLLQKMGDK